MTDALLVRTRDDLARSMTELVGNMARALVDHPEQVVVEAVKDQDSTVLLLRVAQSDLGKVIGKQGRTARSMRTILGAASMKAQHRFALDIQQAGHQYGQNGASSLESLVAEQESMSA